MYLVNSFGRVVPIDDEEEAREALSRPDMRKATEAEIANYQASKALADSNDTDLYFQSVRQTPDGYGMSRDHLKNALVKSGLQVTESYKTQKVGLLYNDPYSLLSMHSPVRLIYTMFESSKIPAEWADYLDTADEIIVPSKWCAEVFARAGFEATVVPLGYNDNVFQYVDRDALRVGDEPFTFIHYNSFNLRKGFQEVFEAFTQEFSTDENVRLILKTTYESQPIPIVRSQFPNIKVITGEMSERELVELLTQADCMVYPSRGEGFGLTPLEAMATGLPAIVPNEHGISEYFHAYYMMQVKAPGRCPGLYSRFKGVDVGEMVVADVDDLRKKMRFAFTHQKEVRKMGERASDYVKQYTMDRTAAHIAEIVKKWQDAEITKRRDSKYLKVEKV